MRLGDQLTVTSPSAGGTCVGLTDQGWAGRVRSAVNTHASSAVLSRAKTASGPHRVEAGTAVTALNAFGPPSARVPA